MRLSIAHYQRMSFFVLQVTQLLDILLDFQLEGFQNHSARPLPGQLVQRPFDLRSLSFSVIGSKLEHGVSFRRFHDRLYGYLVSPQGYAAFLILAIHHF
jgi:hypothetical protein